MAEKEKRGMEKNGKSFFGIELGRTKNISSEEN
jgi:hypothetical protein